MPMKPVPTEVAELRGNPGKRAKSKDVQPEQFDEFPEPPDWLGEYGIKEWYRVGPVLQKARLLTANDWMTFATYCQNVDVLVESTHAIKDRGMTIMGARGPVRNPALATFAAATTALRNMAAEFGMTPSSRSRIHLPDDPDEDNLEDLLRASPDDEVQD